MRGQLVLLGSKGLKRLPVHHNKNELRPPAERCNDWF